MAASSSDAPNDAKPSGIRYAYMFEPDKSPTALLDNLLRAVATHICRDIGDKADQHLTPEKLAAFYKTVGGDYDALFKQRDHTAISYMWQITGCQHSLVQPPQNDYLPPSIPALSLKGFSRWEALEILLGPEEHVPFIQFAVKNWNLKHPLTGEVFPPDLPNSVFPAQADTDVDKWHKSCAAKLWEEASSEKAAEENDQRERGRGRGSSPEKQEPKFTYVHVKSPFYPSPPPTSRGGGDHTRPDPARRPFYMHVPRHGSGPSPGQRVPHRSPEPPRESPDLHDRRRRSFSDIPSPTAQEEAPFTSYNASTQYMDPKRRPTHQQQRRHSQPRHLSSESSEDEQTRKPRHRQQQQSPPTPPYRDRRPPTSSSAQSSSATNRTHRSDGRDSAGSKRHVGNSPRAGIRDKLSEKVSSIFPSSSRSSDRPHSDSRHPSYNSTTRSRGSRAPVPPRPARVESDLEDTETSDTGSSEDETPPRRRQALRASGARDRDHYRDRGRPYVLDVDEGIESPAARRTRQALRRPEVTRRTSSHADADRRRESPAWDPREKDRDRPPLRDDRKRYERRSPDHDRRSPSPLTGVSGRRYPEAAYS